MYIRWLGAFKKESRNILDSIDFEMARTSVAACEHLQKKKHILREGTRGIDDIKGRNHSSF